MNETTSMPSRSAIVETTAAIRRRFPWLAVAAAFETVWIERGEGGANPYSVISSNRTPAFMFYSRVRAKNANHKI